MAICPTRVWKFSTMTKSRLGNTTRLSGNVGTTADALVAVTRPVPARLAASAPTSAMRRARETVRIRANWNIPSLLMRNLGTATS